MNSLNSPAFVLAGKLDDLGNSWIDMFAKWGSRGFKAALIVIVVVYMVQRFSVKAGVGALLLMVVALGLYEARGSLADMVEDEVNNPSASAPSVPGAGGPGRVRALGGVR